MRDFISWPEFNDNFAPKILRIVVVETSRNKWDLAAIFVHCPKSHDANTGLEWKKTEPVMASPLWENSNATLFIKSGPYMVIKFMIFQFWDYFIVWVIFYWHDILLSGFNLLVVYNFVYPDLLLFYFYQRFQFYCSKFSATAVDDPVLYFINFAFTFNS